MTDTIIVKDEEKKPEETVQEPVVVPEDKSAEIAEAASDQAQDMISMAASIAGMLDAAKVSTEFIKSQFELLHEKMNFALTKLDSIFELQQIDVEEENDEVVVAEVKKPDTEEVITTTEEIEEKPEPRSKTKRRFI